MPHRSIEREKKVISGDLLGTYGVALWRNRALEFALGSATCHEIKRKRYATILTISEKHHFLTEKN
jgi:hypothetical protein